MIYDLDALDTYVIGSCDEKAEGEGPCTRCFGFRFPPKEGVV